MNVKKWMTGMTWMAVLAPLVIGGLEAASVTFGSGGFTMEFVDVGNVGNAADDTGYGAVGHDYGIGKYEVTRGMVSAYNVHSGSAAIGLANMQSFGNGSELPATGITWNDAARFVNWLNVTTGHDPAYKFLTSNMGESISLWTTGDSGYDPANPFRNKNALFVLPTEDEWYKAAYYDPDKNGIGGYWDYTTGSDTVSVSVESGTAAGTAVHSRSFSDGPADITLAGGLSPYGTVAQGGNAWEWGESAWDGTNDVGGEDRILRGGNWDNGSHALLASHRHITVPASLDFSSVGFRVAMLSVPEPLCVAFTLQGMILVLLRRKRGWF